MKIREANIGDDVVLDLIVKSATIKYTKPPGNKPYLFMELSDGTDNINANNWDYGDNTPPARNSILSVVAEVTEWPIGTKQLKITKQKVNTSMSIADFAPKGNMDVGYYIECARTLIEGIESVDGQKLVKDIYNDNIELLKVIPAAKSIHHAFVAGTLKHLVDTAQKAQALAKVTPGCNEDLCVIGGLLHDIGKLKTYFLDGVVIDYTDEGNLKDHLPISYAMLEKYRTDSNSELLDVVQHVILTHHGTREFGSPTSPRCIEAIIVYLADEADSKSQAIMEAASKMAPGTKYTDKIWIFENRQMFTPVYINGIMNGYTE
jgi:3'-5' exoribonuclease